MKHFKFILLFATISVLGVYFPKIGYPQNNDSASSNMVEISIDGELKTFILEKNEIKNLLPIDLKKDKIVLKYYPVQPYYLLISYIPEGTNPNYKKVECTIKIYFEQENLLLIDGLSAKNKNNDYEELNVGKFKNDLMSHTSLSIHGQKIPKSGGTWIIPKFFGSVNDIKIEYKGEYEQKLSKDKPLQIGNDKIKSGTKVVFNFNFNEKEVGFKIIDSENNEPIDNAIVKLVIEKDTLRENKKPYTLLILDDPIFPYKYKVFSPFYKSIGGTYNGKDDIIKLIPEKVNLTINLVVNNIYNNPSLSKKIFTPKPLSYNRKDFPIKMEVIKDKFSDVIDDKIWTFANPNIEVTEKLLKQPPIVNIEIKRYTVPSTFSIDFSLDKSLNEDHDAILNALYENILITPFVKNSTQFSKILLKNSIQFTTDFPEKIHQGDKIEVKLNADGLTIVPAAFEFNSKENKEVKVERKAHLHIFYMEMTYFNSNDVEVMIQTIIKQYCKNNDKILIIVTGDTKPVIYDIKDYTLGAYQLPNIHQQFSSTADPARDIALINSKLQNHSQNGYVFDYYLFISTHLSGNESNLKLLNDWIAKHSGILSKKFIYCAKDDAFFKKFNWSYNKIEEDAK